MHKGLLQLVLSCVISADKSSEQLQVLLRSNSCENAPIVCRVAAQPSMIAFICFYAHGLGPLSAGWHIMFSNSVSEAMDCSKELFSRAQGTTLGQSIDDISL